MHTHKCTHTHTHTYALLKTTSAYACLPPLWPTGPAKHEQQEKDSCHVQMQDNPCYAVLHQGPEEDKKEDIAHMQMMENPSYVYNSVTLTPRYQSAYLHSHDRLDCAIYEQIENLYGGNY